MATYTRNELRNAVMYELTILDADEAPEAADAVLVNDRVQQTLEGLYEDGLIPFDLDADAIPARFVVPLVKVIAPTLAMAFGQSDKVATYEIRAEAGMRELRRLKASPYWGAAQQSEYF